MKTLAIALLIISLLAAPKVLADEKKNQILNPDQSQLQIRSYHHDKDDEELCDDIDDIDELDDINEIDDDCIIHSPRPTPTATATPTLVPTETPTGSPTISPTPTETPEVLGAEHGRSDEHSRRPSNQIVELLKQILAYLQSLAPKV
jgi:hypothetical protein